MSKQGFNIADVELQPRPAHLTPKGPAAARFEARIGLIGPKIETAHQIVNTGTAELKYLAVSTMEGPEVCEYPDAGKIAILGESVRYINRLDQQAGYWDDE